MEGLLFVLLVMFVVTSVASHGVRWFVAVMWSIHLHFAVNHSRGVWLILHVDVDVIKDLVAVIGNELVL
jgi:hypothetical protein